MATPAAAPSHSSHGDDRGRGNEYTRRRPEESVLYEVVQAELETFLARAQARARPVPRFALRELRGFLRCGIHAHGFVRVHCDDCGLDRVVAFSCKGRGFCPSCGRRRMADTAAPLVDRVLPEVPVEDEPLLAQLYGASVTSRIATGRRAGQRVIRVGDCIDPDSIVELEGKRCASAGGVSLHANVAVPARDRRRLERLCRCVARPPVATERLSRIADGRLLYRLEHRWRDGTTDVVFEPGELVEKLAALVPHWASES